MYKKIKAFVSNNQPCTQKEISRELSDINRAILLGYLRCMVDMGIISSKDSGKAKVYFISNH